MSKKNKPNPVNPLKVIEKTPKLEEKKPNKLSISSQKRFDINNFIALGLILLITYFCFSSVKNYDFVNWDDPNNAYENKLITSLNQENFWDNTKQIFKTDVIGNYNPLPIFTFALEQKLRGSEPYTGISSPGGWHMTNLWLHLISVILVFFISKRLGISLLGSSLIALLFGIHPMRVESVAWITERKDVLFGMFFLASMLSYLHFKTSKKVLYLFLVYIFFILSLFSKIQAVTLPLSLIAIDYFLDKKFELSSVWKKIPLFAFSLIFGLVGIIVLKNNNSLDANETLFSFWQRFFVGSYSLVIYLVKAVIPFRMSPLYPYPSTIPGAFYPTIIIFPALFYLIYFGFKKNWKALVFGLVFFFFNIVFLLQILAAGQGFIADRFTYIAYFGLFFLAGYAFDKGFKSEKLKIPTLSISILFIFGYIYLTISQVKIWENSGTLWTHVLKYYNQATTPYGNRANYYRSQKQFDLALKDYGAAIALKPEPQTLNSRSKLYFDNSGNSKDTVLLALADLNRAIELKPNDGEFLINRGAMYAKLGDFDKAISSLNQGLAIKPDHISGYLNRSLIYKVKNDIPNAIKDLDQYLSFDPYKANIIYERGALKRQQNKLDEALIDINRAIELGDETFNSTFYYERAVTYYLIKDYNKAKADYKTAVSMGFANINPGFKAEMEKL